jgi:hypothetical protein
MKPFESLSFASRGEFVQAVLAVFAQTSRELLLYDRDFSEWPLEHPQACRLLARLPREGATPSLRLLVRDPEWLERFAPRFGQLRRQLGSASQCRLAPASLAPSESILIADGMHLVRRAHHGRYRGRLSLARPADIEPWLPKYQALWDESTLCLPATALGL